MSRSLLHIGELARLLGVTPKTVRHYHKLGLCVEPERSEAGYRLYTASALFRLRRIRRLQALGLSLQQVKTILDSDDPDALLAMRLKELQDALKIQQEQLEERRQRIEDYLAEGVSLVEIEQPDTPSATYQMLQEKFGKASDFPDAFTEFDKQFFTHLDAFNWGQNYTDSLQQVATRLEAQVEHQEVFTQIMEKMRDLQMLSEDDPQVERWSTEIRQSRLIQALTVNMDGLPDLGMPITEAMTQIFRQSAEQHLAPAQRRFLELLINPRK